MENLLSSLSKALKNKGLHLTGLSRSLSNGRTLLPEIRQRPFFAYTGKTNRIRRKAPTIRRRETPAADRHRRPLIRILLYLEDTIQEYLHEMLLHDLEIVTKKYLTRAHQGGILPVAAGRGPSEWQ